MSIDTDYALLRRILTGSQNDDGLITSLHSDYQAGWAAEFGVYSGYSLSLIAEHMPVIGFDSFEGLPEDWTPNFPKGSFSENTLRHLPYYPMNTILVKGWFEDTAPSFPFPHLGLVHIDCDLYSSTVTALNSVAPFINIGTIIVFDEFSGGSGANVFNDEERAWTEFISREGIITEMIGSGPEERAFVILGYEELHYAALRYPRPEDTGGDGIYP